MLLELFKELSLHPRNAAELKALILQLAVQGKLTAKWREENPDVEPASELLRRVKKVNGLTGKKGKNNQNHDLLEIQEEKFPYELPSEWCLLKMGDGLKFIDYRGKTPRKTSSGVRLITAKNVRPGFLKISPEEFMSDADYAEWMTRGFPEKGDVLFTTEAPLGNVCQLEIDGKVGLAQRIITLQPFTKDINKRYLMYCLMSQTVQKLIQDKATGMTAKGIRASKLKSIAFPLPPHQEQHAIVTTVNQLFAEVEQLEQLTKERIQLKHDFATSALQRLVNANNINGEWAAVQQHFHTFFNEKPNVKKLRETILQLAVQGKLTTHWRKENPGVEPATELLKRITAEKQQLIQSGKIKKDKPLPPIKEEEIPFELPEGWVWCRLGEISDIMAGASFKSNDFNQVGGTRCIKITNAGVREFVETEDYLPNNFVELYPNYLIKEGDLVLALTRPYIKGGLKISVCPKSYHNSLLNQRVAAIRPRSNNVHHQYLYIYMQSPHILAHYKSMFDDKSQQPNMKIADITRLHISMPSYLEQHAIVTIVNTLMGLCDALEQELGKQESRVEELMRSCVRGVVE